MNLISTIFLAGLILSGCGSRELSYRGSVLENPIEAPDFILSNQYGQPFRLSVTRGQIVLLFFGYIYCPDVCPLTLSTWRKVQQALKNDADKVEFVFITVDPERDTPERLRKHLSIFSPDFIGLTGELDELAEVYKSYGVYHKKEKISDGATGYLVGHTAWIYVIDREGKLRLSHLFDASTDDILHDVKQLLKH